MLHPSKSQSILQWFNALTTNVDVESLSQFADGSLFCDIVTSVYSQAEIENPVPTFSLSDCSIYEQSAAEISVIDKSASIVVKEENVPEGNISTSTEQIDEVKNTDESSSNKIDVEENAPKDNSHSIEIKKKYDVIKKFIDDFFQIESSTLIHYPDCMEGQEMELATVAVMLLSAMVQNFLSSYNQALHTITLLEASVQEDIKECLSLLLEKEKVLTKAELHKVLGKATKYKATPRRKTPHRGNPGPVETTSSKKRRGERVEFIMYEDMQESPLKGILQSPNNSQHRTAIAMFKKESEISKLRNALHAEEMRVVDLTLEKRNLNEELLKKREEVEHLKLEFRQYRETTEEREGDAGMERANLLEEIENLSNLMSQQNEELKSLQTENKNLDSTVSDLENKVYLKSVPQDQGDRDMVANVMKTMNEVQQDYFSKESELQECIKKIETLDEDVKAYRQMYEELLNKRESPVVTRAPEVVSNIYNADAKDKLNEKEQEIEKLKKLALNLKNQLKEKTDNMKAVLDKLSSLQEKFEKLLNKTKNCLACGGVSGTEDFEVSSDGSILNSYGQVGRLWDAPHTRSRSASGIRTSIPVNSLLVEKPKTPIRISEDLEVSSDGSALNSSGQVGKLWDASSRENAPNTRSRSTSGICASTPVNPLTVEKLKTLSRSFSKLLIKFKIVDDLDMMQQIDAQTRNIATVEDFSKSFERILYVLKKALPMVAESFIAEMKALKETDRGEKPEKELQNLKEMFLSMKEKLRAELSEMENNLKVAKEEIKDLKTIQDATEKEKAQLKSDMRNWKKEYEKMHKSLKTTIIDKKRLRDMVLTMKLKEKEYKVEPCDECKRHHKKVSELKKVVCDKEKEIEGMKYWMKDMENKIKSYDRQVKDLKDEKAKLESKIQHQSAYLLGSSSARTALIRKYFQLGKAEDEDADDKKDDEEAEIKSIEHLPEPVVTVNTYILHPERKKCINESSLSNNFCNRSIKSVYLPTDDEEDFLNHSSLAQIQNGVYHDPEITNPEERLRELQRRNTFCPPHLQSSYPLELQDMTPSERKYSIAPSRFSARGHQSGAAEPKPITSTGMAVKKRKISEMDTTQPIAPKRKVLCIGTTRRQPFSFKPRTPDRQTFTIGKGKTFKTPSSIRRLMGYQIKKNKMH